MKKVKFFCLGIALLITGCQNSQVISPIIQDTATVQTSSVQQKVVKSSTDTFFPTDPNYTWNYDVVFHPSDDPYVDYNGTYTTQVDQVKKTSSSTVLTLKAIDTLNNEYNFPEITMTKKGLSLKGVTYIGFGSVSADDLKIDFLHLPLKTGDKWDDKQWSGQTGKQEKVTVPAGTFDCWKISVIGTYDSAYTAVGDYWITPGLGIVKSNLSTPGWSVESVLTSTAIKSKK